MPLAPGHKTLISNRHSAAKRGRVHFCGRRNLSNRLQAAETTTRSIGTEADIRTVVNLERAMAHEIGLDYTDLVRLETVIVGLASGALQREQECTVTLRRVERPYPPHGNGPAPHRQLGLEVIVKDHDLGVADLAGALAGNGDAAAGPGPIAFLPQLADEFAIDSLNGRGMRVRVCQWAPAARPQP